MRSARCTGSLVNASDRSSRRRCQSCATPAVLRFCATTWTKPQSHLWSAPPQPSGIDYARLIEIAHQAELARGVNYAALTGATDQIPGQLDLLTGQEVAPQ